MGVFYYFLPGVTRAQLGRSTIEKLGLLNVFADHMARPLDGWKDCFTLVDVSRGPGERDGVMLVPSPNDRSLPADATKYLPANQDWQEVGVDEGRYWLGVHKEAPPTPEGLARSTLISGYEIELGDGQIWVAPVIRVPTDPPRTNLPKAMGCNAAGEFTEELLPEFAWAWEMSGEMIDIFFKIREVTDAQAWSYCVRCLALNYRLGKHEVSRLGLLTDNTYPQVFKSAFEGPLIEAEAKKKALASQNSQPGHAEETPDTDPAAQPSG